MSSVYFGGSRSLPRSAVLAQVVSTVLASGQSVHVGCSAGADQQVIQQALRSLSFSQVQVFAAFAQSGAGACGISAVQVVNQWAHYLGQVQWLAGGPLSVPLAARLIMRSVAAFQGCSYAVFFEPGSGSLAVAARAIAAGLSVFAFSQSKPAPLSSCAGQWSQSSFAGVTCWQWRTAQLSLF